MTTVAEGTSESDGGGGQNFEKRLSKDGQNTNGGGEGKSKIYPSTGETKTGGTK